MKAIFLDIDGVLNSTASTLVKVGMASEDAWKAMLDIAWNKSYPNYIEYTVRCTDPVAVALVNRLIEKSGATLVLSSSHRKHFAETWGYGSEAHLQRLSLMLQAMGLNTSTFTAITPMLYVERGVEIRRWLDEHPEVERWVTLDDGDDILPQHDCNLIKTDARLGLTGENYFAASMQLGINESHILY